MTKLLRPKFLTLGIMEEAADHVITGLLNKFPQIDGPNCHVVIMAPVFSVPVYNEPSTLPPPVQWSILCERSFGNKKRWEYPLDSIARGKADLLRSDRHDGRTDVMPHLLLPGDTRFWGGIKRDGLVVAVSGFQPYFDKMAAGMIADMCIGLAYHAWMTSEDKNKDANFI